MKKSALSTVLLIVFGLAFGVKAEETQISVADRIRSLMLVNNPAMSDQLVKINAGYIEDNIRQYETQYLPGRIKDVPAYTNLMRTGAVLVPESAFCFYNLATIRYAKQYAENFVFDELIDNNKIWAAVNKSRINTLYYNDNNYTEVEKIGGINIRGANLFDKETIEFLQNPEAIEQMTNKEIEEKIIDCKIVYTPVATILYLKGINKDYGIILYDYKILSTTLYSDYLDKFKIYTMADILNSYGLIHSFWLENYDSTAYSFIGVLLDQKPTYQSEAESLQAEGLLQGNDRGLDLLKPLTRIEATTLLVRALGYENEPTQTTSKFTDIPNDNWGVKYANIAADKGITQGIGNNQFAPDDLVTDNQFATLLLRSTNTQEFDWQTAINILIERGIITSDQAATMDLFTRGDMAKIIYEARQQGLVQ
jgi:hypothetical protein